MQLYTSRQLKIREKVWAESKDPRMAISVNCLRLCDVLQRFTQAPGIRTSLRESYICKLTVTIYLFFLYLLIYFLKAKKEDKSTSIQY